MSERLIRCPECGRLGSPKRGGYCKLCDPNNVEKNVCIQCGKPAFRRNQEYEGCPDDWYCRKHWEERNGVVLDGEISDWKSVKSPPCEQCGKPAFKMDKNGYPYCKEHWMQRQNPELKDINLFSGSYQDNVPTDSEIPGSFGIIKDNVGYAR